LNRQISDIHSGYALGSLQSWLGSRQEQGAAIALWRLPHSAELHVLADPHYVRQTERIFELENRKGFLFEAFDADAVGFFLHAEGLLKMKIEAQGLQGPEMEPVDWPTARTHEAGQKAFAAPKAFSPYTRKEAGGRSTSQEDYERMVREGVAAIGKGDMEKVVPARMQLEARPEGLDLLQLFIKAAQKYPNALVSLVSIPEAGTWFGATPEILVAQSPDGVLKTVALAGTQSLGNQNSKDLSWTQKEIEEQAMVSRYIINCFKQIRLREFQEMGPKTSQSGHLAHLKTEFTVDTRKESYPQLASVMLELLHPTSAVCGMPKHAALQFLKKKEGFNRSFFTGYLGPVNVLGDTRLFVNLRCMQILDKHIAFYAGAGITEESIPLKEWKETEMKIRTMKNLLEE
jgi:isochorismate synthase